MNVEMRELSEAELNVISGGFSVAGSVGADPTFWALLVPAMGYCGPLGLAAAATAEVAIIGLAAAGKI